MADANRGARPLSPHISIYRPQWTSVLSILHRITGVGLALGAALVVWWLLAAATDDAYFAVADAALTSWIGLLILFASTWALAYHTLNGLRHLWWDMGYGYEIAQVEASGKAVAAGSAILALAIWLLV